MRTTLRPGNVSRPEDTLRQDDGAEHKNRPHAVPPRESVVPLFREVQRDHPGEYCFVRALRGKEQSAPPPVDSTAPPPAAEPPEPADLMPAVGTVVAGRYKLKAVMEAGNMGSLFEAHDRQLDIRVAMKFVRADLASADAAGRLLTEARAAARISHPSAVRVLNVGVTDQGVPFLVMEFLRGISLSAALAARRCPSPAEAVDLLLPIIGAIAAAHAEGVIHRDIKPHNIVLVTGSDGAVVPKLVDFGIARRTSEPPLTRITHAGTILGSPEYMATEQTLGHDVDGRADVWALCIVLYELVTGMTPFRREDVRATLEAIQEDELKPMGQLCREPELWGILCWGLAKEPAKRCSSALNLGRALASWAISKGVDGDASRMSLAARWLAQPPSAPPGGDRRRPTL